VLNATRALALPILLALGTGAAAQQFDNGVSVRAGAFFAYVDSRVAIGLPNRPGTEIDFESDLDFDRNEILPEVRVGWRINDDWILTGEFYGINRDSETTLAREISVGDTTFPVRARVLSGFESDIYRLTVGYLFFQRERFEFGGALGLHMTEFQIFFEGEASVGGTGGAFAGEGRNLFAPLPTIGAFVNWEPAPKVSLSARVDWLSLTIGDYSGRLINSEIAAAYRIFPRVDAGVLMRYVDYNVEVDRDNWVGEVQYRFRGPQIFVQVGF
jgi:hypothetical protein